MKELKRREFFKTAMLSVAALSSVGVAGVAKAKGTDKTTLPNTNPNNNLFYKKELNKSYIHKEQELVKNNILIFNPEKGSMDLTEPAKMTDIYREENLARRNDDNLRKYDRFTTATFVEIFNISFHSKHL